MFNQELKLGADLTVIRVVGWRREDYFDRTGLMWINPSPNMRCLNQAVLYPGIGLLETTNLSVGRGTDTPFEILGAPWLDGLRLARALNGCDLPGVRFVPVRFTPESSKFAGQPCGGINIIVVDRSRFRPLRTGLETARQLRLLFPDGWQADRYDALLADAKTFEAIVSAASSRAIEAAFQDELDAFIQRRARFLLY
jgi:uncharacterized protein YbbC (DUF1343 family)